MTHRLHWLASCMTGLDRLPRKLRDSREFIYLLKLFKLRSKLELTLPLPGAKLECGKRWRATNGKIVAFNEESRRALGKKAGCKRPYRYHRITLGQGQMSFWKSNVFYPQIVNDSIALPGHWTERPFKLQGSNYGKWHQNKRRGYRSSAPLAAGSGDDSGKAWRAVAAGANQWLCGRGSENHRQAGWGSAAVAKPVKGSTAIAQVAVSAGNTMKEIGTTWLPVMESHQDNCN